MIMKKHYNIPRTEKYIVVGINAICGGSKPFGTPTGGSEEPI